MSRQRRPAARRLRRGTAPTPGGLVGRQAEPQGDDWRAGRTASGPPFDALARAARSTGGLDLLIVFGSRARGDARSGSDWDIGYLANEAADVPGLLAALVETLDSDRVDLVDLRSAGGLLRYRAAREGRLVYEAVADLFDRYRLDALRFWSDNSRLFERGFDDVLESLPR